MTAAAVIGWQPIAQLSGYSDAVYGLAFSPDGTTLAASDGNGKIRLSDTATYQTLAILDGPTKGVFNVASARTGHPGHERQTRPLGPRFDDGNQRSLPHRRAHQPRAVGPAPSRRPYDRDCS
jgi:WD40 repeat protein